MQGNRDSHAKWSGTNQKATTSRYRPVGKVEAIGPVAGNCGSQPPKEVFVVVDGSAGGWEACADGRGGRRAVNSATTTVDIVTREEDIEAITIIQLRFVLAGLLTAA